MGKLNFLFVTMLAPVKPLGVLPTLLARFVEVRSKEAKLFVVRRRCFPMGAGVFHNTQKHFVRLVAVWAVVWHTAISHISYNTELYENVPYAVAQWLFVCVFGL